MIHTFTYFITGGIICMLLALLTLITLVIMYELNLLWVRKWFWQGVRKIMIPIFIVIWCGGFLTYFVGSFEIEKDSNGLLSIDDCLIEVPMAIVHATTMFIFENDISCIKTVQQNTPCFMLLYNLCHFFAALFSLVFILRYIGFYLSARVRFWFRSILAKLRIRRPKSVNVFWGITNDGFILAEDIKKNNKGDVVFVRLLGDNESQTSKVVFDRLLNMIKLNDKDIEVFRKNGYYVTSVFMNTAHSNSEMPFSIKDTLSLKSLNRLIKHTKGRVNLFFFSDNDSVNINDTVALLNDSVIRKNVNAHLYFKARHNAANAVTEHYTLFDKAVSENKAQIHLVDTAYLSVAELMSNKDNHPVNFVEINKDGTVSDIFSCMLIGFGQTGEDVFSFLYEFSAFADTDFVRSPYHFTILDRNASQYWKNYHVSRPMVTDAGCVSAIDAEIGSSEYWRIIDNYINTVRYIVVATGNDEENMNAAIALYEYAMKVRDNMDNFAIYIRMYSDENKKRIDNVITSLNMASGKDVLRSFGAAMDMFTYENIVHEKLQEEAKEYNALYEGKTKDEKDTLWKKISVESLYQKNLVGNSEYTYLSAINESRNKIEQNISNSQHRYTKIRLMGEETVDALPMICRMYGKTEYTGFTEDQKHLMDVMACTEHLRWNAKQELLGFKYGAKKDYVRLTHPCLVDWNDEFLSEEYKSWDCNVVDTSIKMYKS